MKETIIKKAGQGKIDLDIKNVKGITKKTIIIKEKVKEPDEPALVFTLKPVLDYKGDGMNKKLDKKKEDDKNLLHGGIVIGEGNSDDKGNVESTLLIQGIGFGAGKIVPNTGGAVLIGPQTPPRRGTNSIAQAGSNFQGLEHPSDSIFILLFIPLLILITAIVWAFIRTYCLTAVSSAKLRYKKKGQLLPLTAVPPATNGDVKSPQNAHSIMSDTRSITSSTSTKTYLHLMIDAHNYLPQASHTIVESEKLKLLYAVNVNQSSPSVWNIQDGLIIPNLLEASKYQGCKCVFLANSENILIGLMNNVKDSPGELVACAWNTSNRFLIQSSQNWLCNSACVIRDKYLLTLSFDNIIIYDLNTMMLIHKESCNSGVNNKILSTAMCSIDNSDDAWLLEMDRDSDTKETIIILKRLILTLMDNGNVNLKNIKVYNGAPAFVFINPFSNCFNKIMDNRHPVILVYPHGNTKILDESNSLPMDHQPIISIQPSESNENLIYLHSRLISLYSTNPQLKPQINYPIKSGHTIYSMAYDSERFLLATSLELGQILLFDIKESLNNPIATYPVSDPITKLTFLKSHDILIALSSKISNYQVYFLK